MIMREYNRVVVHYENGKTEVKDYSTYQRIGYNNIVKEPIKKHNSLVSFKSEKFGRKKDKKTGFNPDNVSKNIFRAKQKVRQLVNNNESKFHSFITLTFAEHYSEQDLKDANLLFKKFIQRLKYKIGDIDYIAVPELTKKGRVHFHIISSLKNEPVSVGSKVIPMWKFLEEIWHNGFIDIKGISDIFNVAGYLTNYIEKDFGKAFEGRKHFFKSKNVLYPKIDKIDSSKDCTMYNLKNLSYSSTHSNYYCGIVNTNIFDKNFEWKV